MIGFGVGVDFSIIFRKLKKHWLSAFICSVICCLVMYLLMSILIPVKYEYKVEFAITGDMNKGGNDRYQVLSVAMQRYVDILSSPTEEMLICDYMGVDKLPGTIEVNSIEGSNLITVTCAAGSKKDVFLMTRALRKTYSELADRISTNYVIRCIGVQNVDRIKTENKAPIVAALMFLLTFFGYLGVVIIVTLFDGKIHNVRQAEMQLQGDIYGRISHEKKLQAAILVENPSVSLRYTEAIRAIAMKTLKIVQRDDRKILLVSSALENEGKTTTAANLAIMLAHYGKKVLLVETDLRKPALFKIFDWEGDSNFFDYLSGKKDRMDVVESGISNLFFCFTNETYTNADILLESRYLLEFLKEQRENMDIIILDTSPMAVTRDAEVLSEIADMTTLIIRMETCKIDVVNSCIERLQEARAKFLGCILNDIYDQKVFEDESYYSESYYRNSDELS